MSRKLLKQIRNEWKSNLWLMAELLVVSVVMWYIADYIWVKTEIYTEPLGFNGENVFVVNITPLNEKSPDFIKNTSGEEFREWHREMDERFKHYAPVEFSARGVNANPYSPSNRGIRVRYDSIEAFTIQREVSPEFMMVYQIKGNAGETSEQLAEHLRRGEMLLSENAFIHQEISDASFIRGKEVGLNEEDSWRLKVGAIYQPVKYSDFMVWMSNSSFTPYSEEMCGNAAIHVRVKPGMEKDFAENLRRDADRLFRVGNLYISDIRPLSELKRIYNQEEMNSLRDMMIGMGFLLLNIFLGLLGTFWFRTQTRAKDIALRKVCGATERDIFRRLIGEGLLILAMVTPIAVGIDCLLAYSEFNQAYYYEYFSWVRMLGCAGISFALMAMMIIMGISISAKRAMIIVPAETLRDD